VWRCPAATGRSIVADAMETQVTEAAVSSRTISLRELAGFFLQLGTTAFGGPAARIAMMEDELVRRRRWLSREKFLDLLGASNLIPGPSSSELAIHIGYLCGGWRGLLVAGTCFIFPAAVMVAFIARRRCGVPDRKVDCLDLKKSRSRYQTGRLPTLQNWCIEHPCRRQSICDPQRP
jgi:hypothetical protein